jgi:hypothetical protein
MAFILIASFVIRIYVNVYGVWHLFSSRALSSTPTTPKPVIYVGLCVYVYTHTRVCVCMHVYTDIYMYIRTVCVCVCLCVSMCVCVCVYRASRKHKKTA